MQILTGGIGILKIGVMPAALVGLRDVIQSALQTMPDGPIGDAVAKTFF
ncbi:MAG: hypothetical protein WAT09_08075 [Paracoccaceae bacterium]